MAALLRRTAQAVRDRLGVVFRTPDLALSPTPVGAQVWPSAAFLCQHLDMLPLAGTTVVELGSGTGVVGIHAATRGARLVVLTDHTDDTVVQDASRATATVSFAPDGELSCVDPGNRPDMVMDVLRQNVEQHLHTKAQREVMSSHPGVVVRELDWFQPEHADSIVAEFGPIDYVIGSDLTYMQGSYDAPVSTIVRLHSKPAYHTETLLAHQERAGGWQLKKIKAAAARAGLSTAVVGSGGGLMLLQLALCDAERPSESRPPTDRANRADTMPHSGGDRNVTGN